MSNPTVSGFAFVISWSMTAEVDVSGVLLRQDPAEVELGAQNTFGQLVIAASRTSWSFALA